MECANGGRNGNGRRLAAAGGHRATRHGRVGLPIRTRLAEDAHAREGPGVDLIALVEGNLAFLDETNRTRRREYVHPHTTARTATIERGDACALAILEYDLSYPATVTNAVRYWLYEWQA